MKCITSPALDNVEIAMYVDGEADEIVIAHIQQCPFCSERARQWTLLQNSLRKQSYRIDCPTPMELGEYHLGYLPDPQELVIAGHLRECLLCSREVAILENFLTGLAPETNLLGAVKVLIARLVSPQNELAGALRGSMQEFPTYQANGYVILLNIQTANETKSNILGQIAADNQENQNKWMGALAELRKDDQLHFSTEVDEDGAFRYEGAPPSPRELRIWSKAGPVIIVSDF